MLRKAEQRRLAVARKLSRNAEQLGKKNKLSKFGLGIARKLSSLTGGVGKAEQGS
jgi:hypothetical protein